MGVLVGLGYNKMKQLIPFILAFAGSCAQDQKTGNIIVVEESTWVSDIYHNTTRDTIALTSELVDLNFFKTHFSILFRLPDTLTQTQHKSSTRKVWGLQSNKTDFNSNWLDTYIYDDKGRLEYFSYSGCLICSQFPFEYDIHYKLTGEIDRISDSSSNKIYLFYYEENVIKKIEFFEKGKLCKTITRII